MCGDFQAVRNHADLATMACPPKYRQIGGFYRYYSGEKVRALAAWVVAPSGTCVIHARAASDGMRRTGAAGGTRAHHLYWW